MHTRIVKSKVCCCCCCCFLLFSLLWYYCTLVWSRGKNRTRASNGNIYVLPYTNKLKSFWYTTYLKVQLVLACLALNSNSISKANKDAECSHFNININITIRLSKESISRRKIIFSEDFI